MKKKHFATLFFPLIATFPTQAINVGEITSIMSSDSVSLAKEIFNNTESARFVSINVERISSPMDEGSVIDMGNNPELLPTPARLILPGQAKENFRFFYKGPEDDKERYYRLYWTDEPVTEFDVSKNKKLGQATTSVIISTILVVTPRLEHLAFKRQGDMVSNTGNTSFRVISYGPCRDKLKDLGQGCRERYYVMPDVSVKIKHTDLSSKRTRIGIWHGAQFINVD